MTWKKHHAKHAVKVRASSRSQLGNNMKTFESAFTTGDGINFFVRGWEPDAEPKAVIALIHGLGEHTGHYEHVAKALTDAGYAMVGFDLRGHGKSSGTRGHFPSLD